MKTQHITLLALVVTMVSACCPGDRHTYYKFADDEMLAYKEGDTLVYKSNLGNVDSFVIQETSLIYDCWDDEVSKCPKTTCVAHRQIHFAQIPKGGSNSSFYIASYAQFKTKHLTIEWKELRMQDNSLKKYDKMTVNGKEYSKVYYYLDSNIFGRADTSIYLLYYCDRYLLLQYRQINGEVWNLQLD